MKMIKGLALLLTATVIGFSVNAQTAGATTGSTVKTTTSTTKTTTAPATANGSLNRAKQNAAKALLSSAVSYR